MTYKPKWFIIKTEREEVMPMEKSKEEALQELLKILSDCPEVAERITITIKPNSKPKQGTDKET